MGMNSVDVLKAICGGIGWLLASAVIIWLVLSLPVLVMTPA
jgi:hypothetical protein